MSASSATLEDMPTPSVRSATYTIKRNNTPTSQVRFQKLVFLGTGSSIPAPDRRNTSAIALGLSNATTILLDCGEATQHQLMRSGAVRFQSIASILVTHLHGDHCWGIFGLLCTMANQGRTEPVLLVGPVGLRVMVETVLSVSGGFGGLLLEFCELTPGQAYPDLGWINSDGAHLQAYPLQHRIASFGYVLTEGIKSGALDMVKAKAAGANGKQLGQLKAGQDVTLADGRIVRGSECVHAPVRARKIALLQDTSDSSAAAAAVQDVDLLIHECTYAADLLEKALAHGHSTSAMAGTFAASVNSSMLVLTHFSARYETSQQTKKRVAQEAAAVAAKNTKETKEEEDSPLTLESLVTEAKQAYASTHPSGLPPASGTFAAEDFMVIESRQECFVAVV
jgi:ribonuclease Z